MVARELFDCLGLVSSFTISRPLWAGLLGDRFHYAHRFRMAARVDNGLLPKVTLSQGTSPDQRRSRRYGLKLPGLVKPQASRQSAALPALHVETLDVSSSGLFFLASSEWSVGTAIEFELDLPAHVVQRPVKIRCRGTITRVVPQEAGRTGIGATIDHYKLLRSRAQAR